ncbi:MAG: AMP-binding protein [Propionibacteriales bacterium]|nr:AMP-binding protein [Propionibacteriales bacterium]
MNAVLHPDVLAAREVLLTHRDDLSAAVAAFAWPRPETFNFVTDWFDGLATERPSQAAIVVVEEDGSQSSLTFAQLSERARTTANWLAARGLVGGDRLLLVLGNTVPLWEIMLGALRLGVVVIPATPQLSPADLADRVARGEAKMLIAHGSDGAKFAAVDEACQRVHLGELAGDAEGAWTEFPHPAQRIDPEVEAAVTKATDPILLYFTSGTTAQPKLVEHTAVSYPIGHLTTMYWIGLQPGDVHLNISSPGWAKHAWSNLFAPWLGGATIMVFNYVRFSAAALLDVLARGHVTTFCAPPTVWRMLIQADLAGAETSLRELLSAGEPLNPEVIEQVSRAWGITIRDGYGQTETSLQIANTPGMPITPGAMGRPLPGYELVLVDPNTGEVDDTDGELCLGLDPRPLSLMAGYKDSASHVNDELNAHAFRGGVYHTGDVVTRDADGVITYVGRADDVFKASDYRISPFELESVLIEHPAVAEAAVIPSPDPVRLAVPKAWVSLAAGWSPDADTARSILVHCREHLAPYKRIRRLSFGELPKTISGKIRRVELRTAEQDRTADRVDGEFTDADFDF